MAKVSNERLMRFFTIQATSEAEAQCAALCKAGKVCILFSVLISGVLLTVKSDQCLSGGFTRYIS